MRIKIETYKVLAVVVLYKTTLECSVTVQSLRAARAEVTPTVHVLVVDNSALPGAEQADTEPGMTYLPVKGNLGLSNAYNRALEYAEREGYDWLITLDQDTKLPLAFFRELQKVLLEVHPLQEIAAVVPQVLADKLLVSPYDFQWGARARYFPLGFIGVPDTRVFAFNSAAIVRVTAIRSIGGYSVYFWLDCSDAYLFDALWRANKRVHIAGNIWVEHDFSMLHMTQQVSPWRYKQIQLAEAAFWDSRMNWLAGLQRTFALLRRLVKQAIWRENDELKVITRQSLLDRLFRSKGYRRQLFVQAVEEHLGEELSGTALRPPSAK